MQLCAAGGCSAFALDATAAVGPFTAGSGARRDAVLVVGEWYLRTTPWEADRARLDELLRAAIPGFDAGNLGRGLCCDTQVLQRAFERDFASGETVYVGGWLFARTELRLCALALLA